MLTELVSYTCVVAWWGDIWLHWGILRGSRVYQLIHSDRRIFTNMQKRAANKYATCVKALKIQGAIIYRSEQHGWTRKCIKTETYLQLQKNDYRGFWFDLRWRNAFLLFVNLFRMLTWLWISSHVQTSTTQTLYLNCFITAELNNSLTVNCHGLLPFVQLYACLADKQASASFF